MGQVGDVPSLMMSLSPANDTTSGTTWVPHRMVGMMWQPVQHQLPQQPIAKGRDASNGMLRSRFSTVWLLPFTLW